MGDSDRRLYGTEYVAGSLAETLEQRLGRCYELAAYALALGSAPQEAILVHGSIHGINAPERIDHAWLVLPDGSVWEPASGMTWHPHAWDAIARPHVAVRYDVRDVRSAVSTSGHWGPWTDDDSEE